MFAGGLRAFIPSPFRVRIKIRVGNVHTAVETMVDSSAAQVGILRIG